MMALSRAGIACGLDHRCSSFIILVVMIAVLHFVQTNVVKPLGNIETKKGAATAQQPQWHDNGNPNFVLHVGPGKTGTSTIQHAIQQKRVTRLLASDNYTVIANKIIRPGRFQTPEITGSQALYWRSPDFLHFMADILKSKPNSHIFGSSEFLSSPMKCHELITLMNGTSTTTKHWNVHVIITYRRLHSIMPSLWNQRFKMDKSRNADSLGGHKFWPGIRGGQKVQPFHKWLMEYIVKHGRDVRQIHRGYASYRAWKSCGAADTFTLLNYHGSGFRSTDGTINNDLMALMACDGIVGANRTCSALKDTLEAGRKNPSVNLNYDILAVHANEVGLIPNRVSRHEASKMVRDFAEDLGGDKSLRMSCPDSTALEIFYNLSLEAESWAQSFLGGRGSSRILNDGAEHAIRPLNDEQLQAFDLDWKHSVESGKLCSVNGTATLELMEWKKFFTTANFTKDD